MDEVRRLSTNNPYTVHSDRNEGVAGPTRHQFTDNTEGWEHRKVVSVDNLGQACFVEENGAHNHSLATSELASRLPDTTGSQEDERAAAPDLAHSPNVAEHATRRKRLASQNVSKVVQMFKSSSHNTADDTRSPRKMPKRGSDANLGPGSPACDAITPRSRMNPPTPSTASPPPAGGSGHTASTAVAADRLVGEEPISSTEIKAVARGTAAPDGGDDRFPGRYPGYEGVNNTDHRIRVTEYFAGGVVEGKTNEGKPRLALLFNGPEHEYQDDYNWRKYGKKPIKGYANPRFYWRCTYEGCGVQRHTQLLVTGETEVLYDGCHCHLPPPAKAARGRGRGRAVAEMPAAVGRALDTAMTRDVQCARAASSGATTGGNSCGAATRAASSGVATGPPAADDVAGPPLTDAVVPSMQAAADCHAHGEAAAKRKALFMRTARMKAPTAAAMMGSPGEEDFDEPMPVKRARPAAAAAAVQLFPEVGGSPRAAPVDSPRIAAGSSPRPALRRAGTANTRSPMRAVSHQNATPARQSLPVDAQNLSRCPLYFLACVAAKEKFTSV